MHMAYNIDHIHLFVKVPKKLNLLINMSSVNIITYKPLNYYIPQLLQTTRTMVKLQHYTLQGFKGEPHKQSFPTKILSFVCMLTYRIITLIERIIPSLKYISNAQT
jgi:hypothetical protein